jgi:hypothetical protein
MEMRREIFFMISTLSVFFYPTTGIWERKRERRVINGNVFTIGIKPKEEST